MACHSLSTRDCSVSNDLSLLLAGSAEAVETLHEEEGQSAYFLSFHKGKSSVLSSVLCLNVCVFEYVFAHRCNGYFAN